MHCTMLLKSSHSPFSDINPLTFQYCTVSPCAWLWLCWTVFLCLPLTRENTRCSLIYNWTFTSDESFVCVSGLLYNTLDAALSSAYIFMLTFVYIQDVIIQGYSNCLKSITNASVLPGGFTIIILFKLLAEFLLLKVHLTVILKWFSLYSMSAALLSYICKRTRYQLLIILSKFPSPTWPWSPAPMVLKLMWSYFFLTAS